MPFYYFKLNILIEDLKTYHFFEDKPIQPFLSKRKHSTLPEGYASSKKILLN